MYKLMKNFEDIKIEEKKDNVVPFEVFKKKSEEKQKEKITPEGEVEAQMRHINDDYLPNPDGLTD